MRLDEELTRIATASAGGREKFIAFITAAGDAAFRRDAGPEHVTASCFVFSPDLAQTLLCFHRKGGFWVQLGGHVEPGDSSLPQAALREGREESGIADLTLLSEQIADLDRHELGAGFACTAHWDVGFAAIVDPRAVITVSDESNDVRWFPVDRMPDNTADRLDTRVAQVLQSARRFAC